MSVHTHEIAMSQCILQSLWFKHEYIFLYVTKTRAYHLGWYEPSSPSTNEFIGPNMSRLTRPQSTSRRTHLPPPKKKWRQNYFIHNGIKQECVFPPKLLRPIFYLFRLAQTCCVKCIIGSFVSHVQMHQVRKSWI